MVGAGARVAREAEVAYGAGSVLGRGYSTAQGSASKKQRPTPEADLADTGARMNGAAGVDARCGERGHEGKRAAVAGDVRGRWSPG